MLLKLKGGLFHLTNDVTVKTILTWITLIGNTLALIFFLAKGYDWVSNVNHIQDKTVDALHDVQQEIKMLQQWKIETDKRHAIEDATATEKTTHKPKG